MKLYANVRIRENGSWELVPIMHPSRFEIDSVTMNKWQQWLNLISRIASIPSALIMKLNEDTLEVFIKSETPGNPYKTGEKAKLGLGLYCETVIGTQQKLMVPDATSNPVWNENNPDVEINMISYLGFSVKWPTGEIFGTVCILDHKKNEYSSLIGDLMENVKTIIENDLASLLNQYKLWESKELFQAIFENNSTAVFIHGQDSTISMTNQAACLMTGYREDELIGMDWTKIVGSRDIKRMKEYEILRYKDPGSAPGQYEFILQTKSGELKNGLVFISTIPGNKQILASVIDISALKKVETALKESESRLKELNSTKDKFFSIIAHDLKSPFNSILGLSDLIAGSLRKKDYDQVETIATAIHHSSQRAYELLTNLLDWSLSQTGKLKLNPEFFDIGTIITKVLSLAQEPAREKSIALTGGTVPETLVFADKLMVESVIRNLVMNAIKFTNTNGKIDISLENKQTERVIAISDNGVGIPKEDLDKLFRIDAGYMTKGTKNEVGSGLGLILCKEFIEKHNGKIWVESEVGKGSTFRFSIPVPA